VKSQYSLKPFLFRYVFRDSISFLRRFVSTVLFICVERSVMFCDFRKNQLKNLAGVFFGLNSNGK
jgi:hypothetical protein